jgi:hypothetical protein
MTFAEDILTRIKALESRILRMGHRNEVLSKALELARLTLDEISDPETFTKNALSPHDCARDANQRIDVILAELKGK